MTVHFWTFRISPSFRTRAARAGICWIVSTARTREIPACAGMTVHFSLARDSSSAAFVRLRKLVDQIIAAADGLVERCLGILLARPHAFQFLIDHVANLNEVAETDAARIAGRLDDHLLDRNI